MNRDALLTPPEVCGHAEVFPPLDQLGLADRSPAAGTLQQVLERLSALAAPPERFGG